MEFVLRCNDLKCRKRLHERAVVTTCSHVFCSDCADTTGLSRSTNAHRTCPACNASLHNPDDVVVAGLSPSEDYKTSVLSGLSPTIIMECASRALAFHSYQTSQEIIYQEHLAKGLTDKYDTLSQQMDQLIHDANAQIKALQDKMQAMQTEQEALETKNFELAKAYKEKTIAHQRVQNHYQALKGQVNLTHVARAAGNEAAHTVQNAQGDRFIDRLPGTRTGTANYSQMNISHQVGGGRMHNRDFSRSSENSGRLQQSSIHIGAPLNPSLQRRVLGGRNSIGHSAPVGTPSQAHRSQLPVLGGSRQPPYLSQDIDSSYHNSPVPRQPVASGLGPGPRGLSNFSLGATSSRRAGGANNIGPLGR